MPISHYVRIMDNTNSRNGEYAVARDFHDRILSALTINQINKLVIQFRKSFLPLEAAETFELFSITVMPRYVRMSLLFGLRLTSWILGRISTFPGKNMLEREIVLRKWLLFLRREYSQSGARGEAILERVMLAGRASLYKSEKNHKSLLIVFTPRTGRFTPSTPFFLDVVGQVGCDILIFSPEPNQQSPWIEVTGFPPGFDGLIEKISEIASQHAYQRMHTVGKSFSAPMAFFTGIALGASTISPIGLTKGPTELSLDYAELWERSTREIKKDPSRVLGRINFVAGSRNERDVRVARQMCEVLPGSSMVLVDKGQHDPIPALMRRRQLPAFFRSLVSGFELEKAGGELPKGFTVVVQQESSREHHSVS